MFLPTWMILRNLKFIKMKDKNKNTIAASILALGLIFSTVIYAYSNRYEIVETGVSGIVKVDKWSGTAKYLNAVD